MDASKKVFDFFMEIAAMDSFAGREGRLAELLASRLKDLGAAVFIDESAGGTGSDTGNVVATIKGNRPDGPKILLCAHMDTIGPTEGMAPEVREGCIYSNGETVLGADDKAGIAVIMTALEAILSDNLTHGDIEVVFTVQEETGLIGAKNLTHELTSDFGYILDGDGPVGTVINRAPAKINLDLTIKGQAAHAGIAPEQGVNAIVAASTAISQIKSGRIDHETTSNFGTIRGGRVRNIVPDFVEISTEIRSMDDGKLEKEVQSILDVFTKTTDSFGAALSYTKDVSFHSFSVPDQHPAVVRASEAARAIGVDPVLWASGGGLDANIFNAGGLPCVALGLGIEDPHSNQEHIPVAQLEAAVDLLVNILRED
jgi:tripeptide aminopeptidase